MGPQCCLLKVESTSICEELKAAHLPGRPACTQACVYKRVGKAVFMAECVSF